MNSLTKIVKVFADRFNDFANIGFRYIDVPNYNNKLYYSENQAKNASTKISA